MATAIFFNGRRINIPQVASRVDASALQAVSPAAVGIVALLGEAEGGEPLTVNVDNDLTQAGAINDQYRSGDLKTASRFCFEPSADEAVPGGAQRIVPVKVNPSTQSTATLSDIDPKPAVDLTSRDWGQFTEQINIDVAAGTVQGKLITVVFEDITETFDDVGGDAVFTVLYAPGADGYDAITGAITAAAFTAAASKDEAGLDTELTTSTPVGLPAGLEAVSSAAGDTTQSLTIYGLVGTTATQETIALNGTTIVPTTILLWDKVLGASLDAAAAGTITLRVAGAGATALTLAPAVLTRGVVLTTNTPVSGVLTVSIDVDTAVDVAVFGLAPNGTLAGERFDMTTGFTTPVVGAVTFREITVIALGDVAAARTITTAANAEVASTSTFTTVQQLVDRLNSLAGFTAVATVSNPATFNVADADYAAAISLLATASFFADLFAFIDILNTSSQFVTAARASGATAVPDNLATPTFLTGGIEGATTITEWQAAFSLLRSRRVTTIVPLTQDPAVHNLLLTHLIERAGKLRSEANGYVGIGTVGGAGETLTNIRSQIQALNTRHISAISQEVQRFDPDTGLATFYAPHIFGAIAAGMQAGSAIGEPLTRKLPIALDIRNDSSWEVENDGELLIDSGLMFAESVDGVGIRWVRSVTTHLQDDNVVFTEMSANESANTAIFRLRRALDQKIGNRALANSVGVIKGIATDELERLIADEIIVAFRALQVDQVNDVFPVSVEIAPVVPINFIPITVHLVPLRAAA
jgi:hypothetical protein